MRDLDDLPQSWAALATIDTNLQPTLWQPLGDFLSRALSEAAQGNAHTARSYQTAFGLFIEFLDESLADELPLELSARWRPFVERQQGERGESVWAYRVPIVILRAVGPEHLNLFSARSAERGESPSTTNTRLSAIRTLLSVAYRDGWLSDSQAQRLAINAYQPRRRYDEAPVGRRLSRDEVRRLRGAASLDTRQGVRDLAILDCMLYAGLRSEEVVSLTLDQIQEDGGRWWIVLRGKGRKSRRIKVHDGLYQSLSVWLREADLTWHTADQPVFLSLNKGGNFNRFPADEARAGERRPIQTSDVSRLVARYGARAKLAPATGNHRLSPHDLRRTCARNAYDHGATLLQVQALLGHASPDTTAHYIGAYVDDTNTAIDYLRY